MEGEKEYIKAMKLMQKENFSEALPLFETASKADNYYGGLSYGGLGYCTYKLAGANALQTTAGRRSFMKSKGYFEDRNFLKGTPKKEFLVFLNKWISLYYNMGLNEGYENILLNLQNFNPNKEYVPEGETALKDYTNKSFNDSHVFVKFIKAFIYWKVKGCLEKSIKLFNEAEKCGGKQFIQDVEKEENKKTEEIKKTIKDSFQYAVKNYELGTISSLKEAIKIFDKCAKDRNFNQKDLAYIYEAKSKIKLQLSTKSVGNLLPEIRDCFQEAIALMGQEDQNSKRKAETYLEMVKAYIDLEPNIREYDEMIQEWFNAIETIINQKRIVLPEYHLVKGDYYFCIKKFAQACQNYNGYYTYLAAENNNKLSILLESKKYYSEFFADKDDFVRRIIKDIPPEIFDNSHHSQSITISNVNNDSTLINVPVKYKNIIENLRETNQELNNPEFFINIQKESNNLKLEKYQETLFDYLHSKNYTEEKDKVYDDMPYITKIKIIKQINQILKYFIVENHKTDIYLTSYNFVVCNEKEEEIEGAKVKYPIIKLVLLPPDLISKKEEYLYNWNFFEDINNMDYEKGKAQFTKNYFYSFSVLIWEILTRKIPFYPDKNKPKFRINSEDAFKLQNSLKELQLGYKYMPFEIPLEIYDYIFQFLGLKHQPNFLEDDLDEFFEKVEKFPENPINIDLPNESRKQDEQEIKFDPNGYVTRFRNWVSYDLDKDFRRNIIDIVKIQKSLGDINLVNYYGPAVAGYDYDNWYFYTERLKESLAQLMEEGLDEGEILTFLRSICETVNKVCGGQDNEIYINFLDENFMFKVEGYEENSAVEIKILNYGPDLERLQKMFPNYKRPNRKLRPRDIKKCLIEDYLCLVFRMFKDRFDQLDAKNDKELIKKLEDKANNPMESFNYLYKFLLFTVQAYINREKGEFMVDFEEILRKIP